MGSGRSRQKNSSSRERIVTKRFNDKDIHFYTINNRSSDPIDYQGGFRKIVALSDKYDFDGILCFSANETMVDPWLAAHFLIQNSRRLVPIVAVNPVYMHPFSAAKMVSSFAYLHGRRTILNLITGASARDRSVLNDSIGHNERYARLGEYSEIMQMLLSDGTSRSFQGNYYNLEDAVLSPCLELEMKPEFLVAGHSAAATELADRVNAVRLRMLSSDFSVETPGPSGVGLHLGVIAAETDEKAREIAKNRFPSNPELEGMLDYLMEENDSIWKKKLFEKLNANENKAAEFWLEPFRLMKSDCPYIVGSFDRVAEIMTHQIASGIDRFIFDMPPIEDDFQQITHCINLAFEKLNTVAA